MKRINVKRGHKIAFAVFLVGLLAVGVIFVFLGLRFINHFPQIPKELQVMLFIFFCSSITMAVIMGLWIVNNITAKLSFNDWGFTFSNIFREFSVPWHNVEEAYMTHTSFFIKTDVGKINLLRKALEGDFEEFKSRVDPRVWREEKEALRQERIKALLIVVILTPIALGILYIVKKYIESLNLPP